MLSPELQATLQRAVDDVRGRRHEYLTLEHLLLSILDDPSGVDIVVKCGGDVEKLRGDLERFLDEEVDELPDGEDSGPDQTLAFQRVLQRAAMHVQAAGRQQMTTGNVIASMFRERDSHAVYLLEKQGVTRFDVINYISHVVSKIATGAGPVVPRTRGVEDDGSEDARIANPLESFCVDLTQRARGQDRSADRPRRRARAHDPGAVAPPQEQPAAHRRARRRQDRARRGPRAAD